MRHRAWILLMLAACGRAPSAPQPPPEAASPAKPQATADEVEGATTRWSEVRHAADVHVFEATGRLLAPPNGRAEVSLPLVSIIVALRVAPGESVREGQVLAEVVIPEVARADGLSEGARLRAEAYTARLQQLEALHGEGLARAADLADVRAKLAETAATTREAEAVRKSVELVSLRRRGPRYELVSPLAGVVVATNAPIGSVRGPSDGPICTVAGGSASRVEARFSFELPEHVSFDLWSGGDRLADLRLVAQAPSISSGDATRLTWFDLAAPVALPAGSTVRVRMHTSEDTWVVPVAAIADGPPPRVRTQRSGEVPVSILATLGGAALVRGALQAGDMIAEREAAQ